MRFNILKTIIALFIINFKLSIINCVAQELLVNVIIEDEQIETSERQIFKDMKQNITQFMNTHKWTDDKFAPNERINVTFSIRLQTMPSTGKYTAIAQIKSSRPIYGVGLESPMINFLDKDFNFDYQPSQSIEFNDASYINNLGSLLGFYANLILGLDYDSYAKSGGNLYFERALQAMNNAQQSGETGWKQFDNNPNSRYWLMSNMISPQFKDFRDATYSYHRQGLDIMLTKPEEGRTKVFETIVMLKKINDVVPNSCLLRTYFNTKDKEIIDILREASMAEKGKAAELLKIMDPTNSSEYDKLTAQ